MSIASVVGAHGLGWHFDLALELARATRGGRPGEPGYRNKVAAKEPTTPQIPAQSASDRSNVMIKVVPVSGRSSGARFWTSSAASLQSLAV